MDIICHLFAGICFGSGITSLWYIFKYGKVIDKQNIEDKRIKLQKELDKLKGK